jgi:hypothetical protein
MEETAMSEGRLPGEGPLRLGTVALPPGRPIVGYPGTGYVAWATTDPVPDSGQVWADLSELSSQTGLIPILLDGQADTAGRPLDLFKPEDPREADGIDVGGLLQELWRGWVLSDEDDPEAREQRAPFTQEWPGLAAPQLTPLTPAERQLALDSVLPGIRLTYKEAPTARIGLVAAARPADALAVIGWGGLVNRGESLIPLTAVLRSWEDRYGARLIDVGHERLKLLVDRPPRTLEAAQRIAAEQVVLADECIDAAGDVPGIADCLVNAPIWTFWWD